MPDFYDSNGVKIMLTPPKVSVYQPKIELSEEEQRQLTELPQPSEIMNESSDG